MLTRGSRVQISDSCPVAAVRGLLGTVISSDPSIAMASVRVSLDTAGNYSGFTSLYFDPDDLIELSDPAFDFDADPEYDDDETDDAEW